MGLREVGLASHQNGSLQVQQGFRGGLPAPCRSARNAPGRGCPITVRAAVDAFGRLTRSAASAAELDDPEEPEDQQDDHQQAHELEPSDDQTGQAPPATAPGCHRHGAKDGTQQEAPDHDGS